MHNRNEFLTTALHLMTQFSSGVILSGKEPFMRLNDYRLKGREEEKKIRAGNNYIQSRTVDSHIPPSWNLSILIT